MKKYLAILAIICVAAFLLPGCKERKEILITSELLSELGFVESETYPGHFSLGDIRLGDASRDLGFDLLYLRVPLAQPLSSSERCVKIQGWWIYISDPSPEITQDKTLSPEDPNRICSIKVVRAK